MVVEIYETKPERAITLSWGERFQGNPVQLCRQMCGTALPFRMLDGKFSSGAQPRRLEKKEEVQHGKPQAFRTSGGKAAEPKHLRLKPSCLLGYSFAVNIQVGDRISG